jgi:hypothetical protein
LRQAEICGKRGTGVHPRERVRNRGAVDDVDTSGTDPYPTKKIDVVADDGELRVVESIGESGAGIDPRQRIREGRAVNDLEGCGASVSAEEIYVVADDRNLGACKNSR